MERPRLLLNADHQEKNTGLSEGSDPAGGGGQDFPGAWIATNVENLEIAVLRKFSLLMACYISGIYANLKCTTQRRAFYVNENYCAPLSCFWRNHQNLKLCGPLCHFVHSK